MAADPENILIGAGTDFLYNLLIQLLGRDLVYAVEEPGYGKIRKVYAAAAARCVDAPMDSRGVRPDLLGQADVLHISPAHHFPTGIVTPLSRRQELLSWARTGEKWIIEDDYDSEFRFKSLNLPAMQSLDPDRVIYMNTFSKSLAPSIRISYMVLPAGLVKRFQETLGFYSCTVASFEQYTLARFLTEGYFEKHINRMRKFYRLRRNTLTAMLADLPGIRVLEQEAGLQPLRGPHLHLRAGGGAPLSCGADHLPFRPGSCGGPGGKGRPGGSPERVLPHKAGGSAPAGGGLLLPGGGRLPEGGGGPAGTRRKRVKAVDRKCCRLNR